jgi:cell division protein FtsZ
VVSEAAAPPPSTPFGNSYAQQHEEAEEPEAALEESEPAHPKVPRPAAGFGQEPPAVSRFGGEARRRPVVFDEEDDLDVPDFLK